MSHVHGEISVGDTKQAVVMKINRASTARMMTWSGMQSLDDDDDFGEYR